MSDLESRLSSRGAILLETRDPVSDEPVVWLFENPVQTVSARTRVGLSALLEQIDAATREGRFVAGYVSYEAGYLLEPALSSLYDGVGDVAWFGIYDAPIEIHLQDLRELNRPHAYRIARPQFVLEREAYARRFEELRAHIYEGDVYQINLTAPIKFRFSGSTPSLYAQVMQRQSAAFGALIQDGTRTIVSRSPELFFARAGRSITARPMKGTIHRGRTFREDEVLEERLSEDPKSRAENLMIVDLLRNDLSVVSEPGTVRVPSLFATEVHETLIQMTSTIEGQLRAEVGYPEIFRALFPCGSVTGAPRIRAMQVIRKLEIEPRGVYCGAIGWAGPGERAVFSVAIRTAEIRDGEGRLGVGSGVVWDSNADSEYDECLLKARFFIPSISERVAEDDVQLIETMRWDNGISLLSRHMRRLAASASTLGFAFDPGRMVDAVRAATTHLPPAPHRVRMLLDPTGRVTVTTSRLDTSPPGLLSIGIATGRLSAGDPMRRHKTTNRRPLELLYEAGRTAGLDEVLLLNEREEVCEGTRHNIVIRTKGGLVTPPVASGLLPGVYRAFLLETQPEMLERVVRLEDLIEADEIFLCNAVHGLRRASLARDAQGRLVQVDLETERANPSIREETAGSSFEDEVAISEHR